MRYQVTVDGHAICVYQGLDTDCQTRDRRNPDTYKWYWAPVDYTGDTLWSEGHKTREEAEQNAREYYSREDR